MVKEKKPRGWSTTTKVIISTIIAVVIVSLIGYPALTGHFIIECEKEIQVPYETQETYIEREPYTYTYYENVPIKYTIKEQSCNCCPIRILGGTVCPCITIKNIDDTGGYFAVTSYIYKGGTTYQASKNIYIHPDNEEKFQFEYSVGWFETPSCNFNIQEPTKQIEKQEIRYREVEKTRTVTKLRTEIVKSFSTCFE